MGWIGWSEQEQSHLYKSNCWISLDSGVNCILSWHSSHLCSPYPQKANSLAANGQDCILLKLHKKHHLQNIVNKMSKHAVSWKISITDMIKKKKKSFNKISTKGGKCRSQRWQRGVLLPRSLLKQLQSARNTASGKSLARNLKGNLR